MTINLQKPDITELKPKITVFGVGGGGGNAVNNMIHGGLQGVEFVVANTDAQALTMSAAEKIIQLGVDVTEGLGAGSSPDVGAAAAEECLTEIQDYMTGTHMAFVTAGMGGGTGTGAAPVVARAAREMGILTVGVVTKPFQFEGQGRMKTASAGIAELQKHVDSLIVIPNQNLFRIANDKTTFADAFGMADQVLYSGVACITDLMVKEGLINLDFADVRSVMRDMGKAMMGTGEASGEGRAMQAAEAAISNPLLDESSMRGAGGLLISITGGRDLTLFEVDEAATRIREEVDEDANIILGATFDENLEGVIRVSVVATGIDHEAKAISSDNSTVIRKTEAVTRSAPAALAAKPAIAPIPAPSAPTLEKKLEQAAAALELPESKKIERDGVTLEPFKPTPTAFSDREVEDEFKAALESELQPSPTPFVPPAAEEPGDVMKSQPIPSPEDFPAVAQSQLKAAESSQTTKAEAPTSHGPMGLLNKLKNSFTGRDDPLEVREENKPAQTSAPEMPKPVAAQPAPAQRVEPVRVADDPYAPKRASLDTQGRINPSERPGSEDDQLDIPAFLRRQAN
ncbi:MAG: cell division protein FtsZ [Rhizobiaceae bacterium]|nr:cell division protein FtsZ [Rhizobiaceae bacterium]